MVIYEEVNDKQFTPVNLFCVRLLVSWFNLCLAVLIKNRCSFKFAQIIGNKIRYKSVTFMLSQSLNLSIKKLKFFFLKNRSLYELLFWNDKVVQTQTSYDQFCLHHIRTKMSYEVSLTIVTLFWFVVGGVLPVGVHVCMRTSPHKG